MTKIITVEIEVSDVTTEYEDISEMRNQALDNVIDPMTKNILKYASESNLDEIVGSIITKYEVVS